MQEMALHFVDPADPTKYQDMRDRVYLDEKWLFLTQEKERYLLVSDERNPPKYFGSEGVCNRKRCKGTLASSFTRFSGARCLLL